MRAGAPGRGSAGGSVEVAVEIKAGTEAGTEVGTRADASIAAFCDAIWLEDGLAANSLAAYRRDLKHLAAWLATRDSAIALEQASEGDVLAYIAARHAGAKATSSNRRLAVFRRYFRDLVREGLRPDDPPVRIRPARQPPRFPKAISEAQVEAILSAVRNVS